jgi:hypothetical protein
MTMRRLAPLLALALTATGCTSGGGPEPTAAPTTTAPAIRSPEPVRPTGGLVSGGLVYATATDVWYLPRQGTPRRLASARGVRDLAVSAAGRYAAWVSPASGTSPFVLGVRDLVGPDLREWTSPDVDADALDLTNDGFVTVDGAGVPRLLRFDPDLVLRGGEPEVTPIRGLGSARLLAAAGDRILVADYGDGGDTVYDLDAGGGVTRLFRDDSAIPGRGVRRLPILAAALTRDGRGLVYGTGMRGTGDDDECTLDYGAAVRDLTTGRAVPMGATPTLGDDVWTLVRSVTTGADGRTVAGFGTEMESCGGQPLRGAAYAAAGGRWTLVARGATWAATGPVGDLATLSAEGVLTVGGRRVATGVRIAAWSPV